MSRPKSKQIWKRRETRVKGGHSRIYMMTGGRIVVLITACDVSWSVFDFRSPKIWQTCQCVTSVWLGGIIPVWGTSSGAQVCQLFALRKMGRIRRYIRGATHPSPSEPRKATWLWKSRYNRTACYGSTTMRVAVESALDA